MQKGFTLIETLVTALILSIVLLGTSSVLALSHQISDSTFKIFMKRSQLTNAFDLVKNDVRSGSRIETSNNNSKLIIFDENNAIYCSYYKDSNNNLVRKSAGNEITLNMNDVKFDWLFSGSNNSLSVSMSASYDIVANSNSSEWEQMNIYCRNHIR